MNGLLDPISRIRIETKHDSNQHDRCSGDPAAQLAWFEGHAFSLNGTSTLYASQQSAVREQDRLCPIPDEESRLRAGNDFCEASIAKADHLPRTFALFSQADALPVCVIQQAALPVFHRARPEPQMSAQ